MTPTPEPPSTPAGADQPAPYAPYGQPQPFPQTPTGEVPEDPAPAAPPYDDARAVMHPSANTAMVMGIISLGGVFLCGIPLLLAPFAWFIGARTIREIDADPTRFSGRDRAYAGRAMGMTGTALLVLAIVVISGFEPEVDETGNTSYHYEF